MKHHELTETTIATVDLPERIESVKAGLLGALMAGLVFGTLVLVNGWLSPRFAPLATLSISVDDWRLLLSGAIAALSGFLFGITYRYIIRQDQNTHLKAGAVLAFGLVRGLASAEGQSHESIALLPLIVVVAESLVLFAGVRVGLDRALSGGWVKPFGAINIEPSHASGSRPVSSSYRVKSSKFG